MSLITTIDQVREVIGSAIRKENTIEIFKPYLDKTEQNLITELIGKTQLDALAADQQSALLPHVQRAIVWNAYQDAWYQGFYQFGAAGVNRQKNDKIENLFRYQEDSIQKDIVRKADEATERLMLFLESNAANYPLYKQSEAFTRNFTYLIASPTALQKALPEVSKSFRMYSALSAYMDRTENTTVRVVMGGALFGELKNKVSTGAALDGNYKRLLTLAQEYVAPATLLDAMPWIRVQFSPAGIRVLSVLNNLQDETPINDTQTAWLMDILRGRIDTAKTALRMFLNDVASETVFPDYFNSPLYRAPGSRKWTMPENEGRKHFRM